MNPVLPLALAVILGGPNGIDVVSERTPLLWLIPRLGLISALGLSACFHSSRLLPFGLFGLLIYVEPVLLGFVSFALGEHIADDQWLTYVPVWLTVGVLVREGVVRGCRLRTTGVLVG